MLSRSHLLLWFAINLVVACARDTTPRGRSPPSVSGTIDPSDSASLDSLVAAGESTYYRGEYDSARHLWNATLLRARSQDDSAVEGRILTLLGLTAWRQGEYGEARRLGEAALRIKETAGLTADLFKSYNALGLLAWNEGRFGDALALFRQAGAAAARAKDRKGVAAAAGNLALVETELGNFTEARRGFASMRAAGRELGDERIEGNALTNLGMLSVRIGDPREAISYLGEARRLYRSISYSTGEQNALGQLGTAYTAAGEPRLALVALDSALELSQREGLRQDEASNLEALAEIYGQLGDFRRALELYRSAGSINRKLGLIVESGADLRSEAEISSTLGDQTSARTKALEALTVHREAGARLEVLEDLLLLAELSSTPESARAYLQEARSIAQKLDVSRARVQVALAEARLADRAGRAAVVLQSLNGVRSDLEVADYGLGWQAHLLTARALRRSGRRDAAESEARRAVAAVEAVRGSLVSAALRTSYLSDKREPYRELVELLLERGDTAGAFETADRSRGRSLLELLPTASRDLQHQGARVQKLAQRETQLRIIDQLVQRLGEAERDSAQSAGREAIRQQLGQARREYENQLVRSEEHGATEPSLLGATPGSAGEIQAALEPGEVLLEYFDRPRGAVAFVVTRDGIRSVGLESGTGIEARIRLARDLIATPGPSADPVLEKLYRVLVEPIRQAGLLDRARTLVLVRHGALSYLPFAALREPVTGRYLIEDFAVISLPSGGTLPAIRSPDRSHADSERSASGFVPLPKALPASRAEGKAFAETLRSAELFQGGEATERALRDALATSGLVHVATHGVLNAWNPMFSRIELARAARTAPSEDDGRLEVHEVLGLRIVSDLVFLSGCETGLGIEGTTGFLLREDLGTLAQAFLYAGARNVVATLWRVEDQAAAELAEQFYRRYRATSPAQALADAQRALLQRPERRAPYYWAAYELIGAGLHQRPQIPRRVSVQ